MFDVERFTQLMQNKPDTGVYLQSLTGDPVRLRVEDKPDRGSGPTRVIFTYAVIDDRCQGWFLADDTRGVVCQLTSSAQEEMMRRSGGDPEKMTVSELYVVRRNIRGTSLICDLADEQ
jgi:hypothetical protein